MSALTPENKKPRLALQPVQQPTPLGNGLKRTESTMLQEEQEVVKSLPTGFPPTGLGEKEKTASQTHPKGHRVKQLSDVWKNMDSQGFLHLSDTLQLMDVWVQPIRCAQEKGSIFSVVMKQYVMGPHIKSREATTKMGIDDLVKSLYLCDMMRNFIENRERISYDEWVNEKTAICVKAKGVEAGIDKGCLCNFILGEDPNFTLHPNPSIGVFVRKTCYHSYKDASSKEKLSNQFMMKCVATRGKFEYILEATIFPVPPAW